jgi:hypothetical protein
MGKKRGGTPVPDGVYSTTPVASGSATFESPIWAPNAEEVAPESTYCPVCGNSNFDGHQRQCPAVSSEGSAVTFSEPVPPAEAAPGAKSGNPWKVGDRVCFKDSVRPVYTVTDLTGPRSIAVDGLSGTWNAGNFVRAPESLCYCCWHPLGECPHCPKDRTGAHKMWDRGNALPSTVCSCNNSPVAEPLPGGSLRPKREAPDPEAHPIPAEEIERLRAEVGRLTALINTPEIIDFVKAVQIEAVHQRERWPAEQDAQKSREEWFWTLGYLAGKALAAQRHGDSEKFAHHLISSAALLCNWHAHAVKK